MIPVQGFHDEQTATSSFILQTHTTAHQASSVHNGNLNCLQARNTSKKYFRRKGLIAVTWAFGRCVSSNPLDVCNELHCKQCLYHRVYKKKILTEIACFYWIYHNSTEQDREPILTNDWSQFSCTLEPIHLSNSQQHAHHIGPNLWSNRWPVPNHYLARTHWVLVVSSSSTPSSPIIR